LCINAGDRGKKEASRSREEKGKKEALRVEERKKLKRNANTTKKFRNSSKKF
jgi:hypothetical protein